MNYVSFLKSAAPLYLPSILFGLISSHFLSRMLYRTQFRAAINKLSQISPIVMHFVTRNLAPPFSKLTWSFPPSATWWRALLPGIDGIYLVVSCTNCAAGIVQVSHLIYMIALVRHITTVFLNATSNTRISYGARKWWVFTVQSQLNNRQDERHLSMPWACTVHGHSVW